MREDIASLTLHLPLPRASINTSFEPEANTRKCRYEPELRHVLRRAELLALAKSCSSHVPVVSSSFSCSFLPIRRAVLGNKEPRNPDQSGPCLSCSPVSKTHQLHSWVSRLGFQTVPGRKGGQSNAFTDQSPSEQVSSCGALRSISESSGAIKSSCLACKCICLLAAGRKALWSVPHCWLTGSLSLCLCADSSLLGGAFLMGSSSATSRPSLGSLSLIVAWAWGDEL